MLTISFLQQKKANADIYKNAPSVTKNLNLIKTEISSCEDAATIETYLGANFLSGALISLAFHMYNMKQSEANKGGVKVLRKKIAKAEMKRRKNAEQNPFAKK